MPGSGERAYVYAKACGIVGNSFIGKRLSKLGGMTRLSELDRLIFGKDARDLPEQELLVDLERRIINRTARQIIIIVDSFPHPPELLVRLIRDFEYTDLKRVITAAAAGERNLPQLTDIGRFATINYKAYPHFSLMLKGTEFEFLLEDLLTPLDIKTMVIQNKLDHHYYFSLWKSMLKLAPADRKSIEQILSEEVSLRNSAWALRMRTYYGMSEDQAGEFLVSIPALKDYHSRWHLRRSAARPTLADDAQDSLSMALDSPADWDRWRWVKFLNPHSSGEAWTADPRYFQNAAAEYLYTLARRSFRIRPFSLDMVACFIKIKLFEEDLLISVAEGLSLGMPAQDILNLLGVAS
ncbi:V-type ATPase subunit [Treponema primitia]|uniref:V0D/AC39 family V-type ATPase subunit n=1 Tax=Treponema primitia TaxID=88058 RepID=UPI0039812926